MLFIPLGVVLNLGGPGDATTIRIYTAAIVGDVIAFGAAGLLVLVAALRAARGDVFTIPLVTPLSERLFRHRRR